MSPWYGIDAHVIAAQLGTHPEQGLPAAEAARRLITDGAGRRRQRRPGLLIGGSIDTRVR